MKIFPLLLILFISTALPAQEQSYLECHYTETFKDNLDKKNKVSQDEMILRIGKNCSEFFSLWRRERDNITDSLLSKGAALSDVIAARDKITYPISMQRYTIYKNYPQKGMITHIDKLDMQYYMHTSKMQTPEWNISQEKKKILGFDCQKATTSFYGRLWHVWFTMEIPIQEGPWKLCGLPGLILQAEDSEKDYCFECIAINKKNAAIKLPKRHYIKCNEEEFTRIIKEYNSDMVSFMKKQGRAIPIPVGGTEQDTSESLRKNYNYIEK